MELNREIAAEWWHEHVIDGVYARSDQEFPEEQWERAEAVEQFLGDAASRQATLVRVIEVLAETAPPGRRPYIGTWFLENAYPLLGDRVFDALASTSLTAEEKIEVRSGFVW